MQEYKISTTSAIDREDKVVITITALGPKEFTFVLSIDEAREFSDQVYSAVTEAEVYDTGEDSCGPDRNDDDDTAKSVEEILKEMGYVDPPKTKEIKSKKTTKKKK
jgi:hypothetical protein